MKKTTEESSDYSRYFTSGEDQEIIVYNMICWGGILIGHNTRAMSGALVFLRHEFPVIQRYSSLQGILVSIGIAGSVAGLALGRWISDKFGRKSTFVLANFLIFFGGLLTILAFGPWLIILGRLVAGIGAGLTSINTPLYISEACPPRMRGTVAILDHVMVVMGQLISYYENYMVADVTGYKLIAGNWRGVFVFEAAIAVFQMVWMTFIPESPIWLYRKGKKEDAVNLLNKMYLGKELKREVQAVKTLHEAELLEEDSTDTRDICTKLKDAWSFHVVCDNLLVRIGLLVFQQLVGINAIIYYGPTLLQIAGIASVGTAMVYSGVVVGLGALCSGVVAYIVRKNRVKKFGRKVLMIISKVGIIACIASLVPLFAMSNGVGPKVDGFETVRFGNSTCPAYLKSQNSGSWNCKECLDASSNCGFCSNPKNVYGPCTCLIVDAITQPLCEEESEMFTRGCPSRKGEVVFGLFVLFSLSYSIGIGTIPELLSSEIVPSKHKDGCNFISSMATGISTLVVCQWFLSILEAIGAAHTFVLLGVSSIVGLCYIIWIVPGTKDVQHQEVEMPIV